jgi:hypothetical protein
LTYVNAVFRPTQHRSAIDPDGGTTMDTVDMLFLGLVLFAFTAFSATVMWVLHDDVRNRERRAAAPRAQANDAGAPQARAA